MTYHGGSEPIADEFVGLPLESTDEVFHGRIWDVRRETVEYDGTPMTREFVDHTGAVAILALDHEDRVLLIKQYRHAVRRREWEIPAGLLDAGAESPLDAAKRELSEEVDLVADEWSVLTDMATTPGGNNECIRVYLARGLRDSGSVFEREHEEADLERRWVPLDDAVDAVLERRVHNGSLMLAVLCAQSARARGWATLAAADSPWPEHPYFGRPQGGAGGSRFPKD